MPGQRSKKKKHVGAYVDYKLKQELESISIEDDVTVSDVIVDMLKEGVQRYKTGAYKPSEKHPDKEK